MMLDFRGEYVFSRRERGAFWVHTLFACICFPVCNIAPSLSFVLLTPYLLWSVFQPKPERILSLLLFVLCGSQQRYVILFGCFCYALFHFNSLLRHKIALSFVVYLLTLPFFIWLTHQRLNVTYVGQFGQFGSSFSILGMYFVLAVFFWAALAFPKIPQEVFKGLYWISISLSLFRLMCMFLNLQFFVGLQFLQFAYAYSTVYPIWLWTYRKKCKIILLACSGLCIVLYLVAFAVGAGKSSTHTSFSPLFLTIISVLIFFVLRVMPNLFRFLNPILIFACMALYVWDSPRRVELYRGTFTTNANDAMRVANFNDLYNRLMSKSVDDRASLWMLAIKSIKEQFARDPIWVPPFREVQSEEIYDEAIGGVRQAASNLPAHNLFLQMLQDYGLWGGGGMLLTYLMILSRKKFFIGLQRLKATNYGPSGVVAFVVGLFGGFSSANPVAIETGFIWCCIAGVVYRYSQSNHIKKMGNFA